MACMAEWTSLSVKEETRDRFNDAKAEFNENQDSGLPDIGTDQFVKMLLDTLEHAQDGGYGDNTNSIAPDELAREVSRQLDYAELSRRVASDVVEELR